MAWEQIKGGVDNEVDTASGISGNLSAIDICLDGISVLVDVFCLKRGGIDSGTYTLQEIAR